MKFAPILAALIFATPALAQTAGPQATATAAVTVSAQLKIAISALPGINFNPANPVEVCNTAPGTVVAAVTVTAMGAPAPATLGLTDPANSFVLSGTTAPANILVGPQGISPTLCPAAGGANIIDTVTVSATP